MVTQPLAMGGRAALARQGPCSWVSSLSLSESCTFSLYPCLFILEIFKPMDTFGRIGTLLLMKPA